MNPYMFFLDQAPADLHVRIWQRLDRRRQVACLEAGTPPGNGIIAYVVATAPRRSARRWPGIRTPGPSCSWTSPKEPTARWRTGCFTIRVHRARPCCRCWGRHRPTGCCRRGGRDDSGRPSWGGSPSRWKATIRSWSPWAWRCPSVQGEACGVLGEDTGLHRPDPGGLGGGQQGAQQRESHTEAPCPGVDVDGVLDHSGVRAAVGHGHDGGPTEYTIVPVEGDQAVLAQPGRVESLPVWGGGLEGGVALVDAEPMDRQDLVGVLGPHRRDVPARCRGCHAASMPRSASRPRTRRSMSSRIGRTAPTPCPAGSSSFQSR